MSSLKIHTGQVPITHDVGLYECTKIMVHTYPTTTLRFPGACTQLDWLHKRVIGTFLVVQWLALDLLMHWVWA